MIVCRNSYLYRWGLMGLILVTLACGLGNGTATTPPTPLPPTVAVARFNTPEPSPSPPPTATPSPTETPQPTDTATRVIIPSATTTSTVAAEETVAVAVVDSSPVAALPRPTPAQPSPPPIESPSLPTVDFVLRLARLRSNEENSWEGTLGAGGCGSDHSIYVHVADAQENLLDDILIGDKFGNFQVPTGGDGPGTVRILVWSATMELSVVGQHPEGRPYSSDFTPPLSTLDEAIPLGWLEEGGYCDSPEDCQQRVESNQLCRGHYSYDVIFQRTW